MPYIKRNSRNFNVYYSKFVCRSIFCKVLFAYNLIRKYIPKIGIFWPTEANQICLILFIIKSHSDHLTQM